MIKISVLGNYDPSIYKKQLPIGFEEEHGVTFYYGMNSNCDAYVILNQVPERFNLRVFPEMALRINQEPYIPKIFPWQNTPAITGMREHGYFRGSKNVCLSNLVLPWHLSEGVNQVIQSKQIYKSKLISSIVSNKRIFAGHKARMRLMNELMESYKSRLDFFGKGINYISKKEDGLYPYLYSIAIENSVQEGYWTEKITDCILAETVPIYYGSQLPETIFPKGSYIRLEELKHDSFASIFDALSSEDYMKRLPSLLEAKKNLIERDSFFPQVVKYFKNTDEKLNKGAEKIDFTLAPCLTFKQKWRKFW